MQSVTVETQSTEAGHFNAGLPMPDPDATSDDEEEGEGGAADNTTLVQVEVDGQQFVIPMAQLQQLLAMQGMELAGSDDSDEAEGDEDDADTGGDAAAASSAAAGGGGSDGAAAGAVGQEQPEQDQQQEEAAAEGTADVDDLMRSIVQGVAGIPQPPQPEGDPGQRQSNQ